MDHKQSKNLCFKTVPVPGRQGYDVAPPVKEILKQANNLTAENFEILCLELMKTRKLTKEQIVRVKNLLIHEEKRAASQAKKEAKDLAKAGGSGQPRMADPGPSCSLSNIPAPATKVPLIIRTDLVAATDILALDTEKIIDIQHKPLSGDVAVVDLKGRLVYWAYIQRPRESVCRLNTVQTGLTMTKLEIGISQDLMQTTLAMVLNGKTVTGMKLKDDLDHLGFSTANLPAGMKICELQDFFTDQNHQPIKLSQLAIHFIGTDPQEGAHSSVRDARITAICYRRMLAFKEAGYMKFQCDSFNEFRQKMKNAPKPKQIWEPCRCGLSKKKVMKKKQPTQMARLYIFDDADLSDWE